MVLAWTALLLSHTVRRNRGNHHHKFYHHVLGSGFVSSTGARAAAPSLPTSSEPRAQREEENAVCSGQQDRVVGRKELFTLAGGGYGGRSLKTTKRACGVSRLL